MRQLITQLVRDRISGLGVQATDDLIQHLHADDDMPNHLAAIGVGDLSTRCQFFNLAQVMQKTHHRQVGPCRAADSEVLSSPRVPSCRRYVSASRLETRDDCSPPPVRLAV